MKRLLLVLASAAAFAAEGKLTFIKSFPGSVPAYVKITVEPDGKAVYVEAEDDPLPLAFQLKEAEFGPMFALAEKLGHFTKPIESGLPVAKMGEKTFRWEAEGKTQEQKFNYSTEPEAQTLADWFERISESERALIELEKAARFDKLGVNKAILQIQANWERKRLVAADQYLKWLDRIVKNESYLNMARERAARLAELFRNPSLGEEKK